jgi:hypothetical protein
MEVWSGEIGEYAIGDTLYRDPVRENVSLYTLPVPGFFSLTCTKTYQIEMVFVYL